MNQVIQHRMRVRYSETDPQGVVFNAHYLTYFDCTINEAFRDSGVDWLAQMRQSGCDVQLVKSLVEYKAPLRFDEEFCCEARVARLGRSSVTWALTIWGQDPADRRATGEIVWVSGYMALGASFAPFVPQIADMAGNLTALLACLAVAWLALMLLRRAPKRRSR